LTENVGFKELSATGSSLGSVKFAPNGLLETANLSSNIKELSLVNLANLSTLSIPTGHKLERLRLENCPKIDNYALISSLMAPEKPDLQYLRLIGIDWDETASIDLTQPSKNLFDKLGKIGGISESGNIFTLDS
jgi:hypothetical protein